MEKINDIILIRIFLTNVQLRYLENKLSSYFQIIYLPNESSKIGTDITDRVKVLVVYKITAFEVDKFKNLKFVQVYGRGMEKICLKYLQEKNILYKNCRSKELSNSIGEYVLLQILYWERELGKYNRIAHLGEWNWKERNNYHFRALKQLKVGIIGNGYLGRGVSAFLGQCGVKTLKINVGNRMTKEDYKKLKRMDYVSLHLPLSVETKQCIDKKFFEGMKDDAVLINTARGEIINENELVNALEYMKIRGASLDVTKEEPLSKSNILCGSSKIIITPHIAGRSDLVLNSNVYEIVQNIYREVVKK